MPENSAAAVHLLLFRGVGGATKLPTARLRPALEAAGFERVATYIASGNAVVCSRLPRERVLTTVAELCRREFGFEKAIFAPSLEEWQQLIEANPFPDSTEPGVHLHAALLEREPTAAAIAAVGATAVDGEGFAVVGRVAYLRLPHGAGRSKLAAKFDRGIGVTTTARNWNTVLALRELAQAAAFEEAAKPKR